MTTDSLDIRILEASSGSEFWKLINEEYLSDGSEISEALVALHNQNKLNIIQKYSALTKADAGSNSYSLLEVLRCALANINEPTSSVIQCLKNLSEFDERGLLTGFSDFCEKDPLRPQQVIDLVLEDVVALKNFLISGLVAGSKVSPSAFVELAIKLLSDERQDVRVRAAMALGHLDYTGFTKGLDNAFVTLEALLKSAGDDQFSAEALKSVFSLYKKDNTKHQQITILMSEVLSNAGELTLDVASQIFMFDQDQLSAEMTDSLLGAFLRVQPSNRATVSSIDYGLTYLIKAGEGLKAVDFVEQYFLRNYAELLKQSFNDFSRVILEDREELLSFVVTKWMLNERIILARYTLEMIETLSGKGRHIFVDASQLEGLSESAYVSLSRKACGWFYHEPVTAACFILSIAQAAPANKVSEIVGIIFNPLLISYPGSVKDFLLNLSDEFSDGVKALIPDLILKLDNHHDGFSSTRELNELSPSLAHREAYYRMHSRMMSQAHDRASEGSIFGEIFGPPKVLLYGNSSIHYIHHGQGSEPHRQVVPMQTISTSIERSSLEILDPHNLVMQLTEYRKEKISG